MQDAIINETGNSRYLRSIAGFLQAYPNYDSFAAALIAGTLPIDLNGINPDGFAQMGTDLNKANMLTDATAALADLGPEATPDQMFAALANSIGTAVSTAQNAQAAAQTANSGLTTLTTKVNSMITKGTSDMTAGSTNLADNVIYAVYE